MKLFSKITLTFAMLCLALFPVIEMVWGSSVVIPSIDYRIRNADVIVVGKLITAQESHWSFVSNAIPEMGVPEVKQDINWGLIEVKEVLKSPEEGHRLMGARKDCVNLVYKGSGEVEMVGIDFTLKVGTEGIWLLHECSKFDQSLFRIGFYYINYGDECLDINQLPTFRNKYANMLD